MFKDRRDAGRKLAEQLNSYRGTDAIVIAIPRGGVVVAQEIASDLALPLDIVAIRKVGHPQSPEYAIGAVDEHGEGIWNETVVTDVNPEWLKEEALRQEQEARRRSVSYRKGSRPVSLRDKIVILVDDGMATGLTMKLAVLSIQKQLPMKIVVAIPVAPPEALLQFSDKVDQLVVLEELDVDEGAIQSHFEEFEQVGDDEVVELLHTSSALAT